MSRGERRVGIVDRLVLADEAAQLGRQGPRARLERGVLHHFVGLHRAGGGGDQQEAREREAARSLAIASARRRAPPRAAADRAGAGAPKRSRRSASDSAPPSAITQAPSQISVTSGFQ